MIKLQMFNIVFYFNKGHVPFCVVLPTNWTVQPALDWMQYVVHAKYAFHHCELS